MPLKLKKFMNLRFLAIVLSLLAWSIGSYEALSRGLCHIFCKHMCGSVINFLYFNSKGWKKLPKKLPLKNKLQKCNKILSNCPIQLKNSYQEAEFQYCSLLICQVFRDRTMDEKRQFSELNAS